MALPKELSALRRLYVCVWWPFFGLVWSKTGLVPSCDSSSSSVTLVPAVGDYVQSSFYLPTL